MFNILTALIRREELSLEFKCNSVKVQSVVVVAKIWCQFLKQGKS